MREILRALEEALQRNEAVALATVIEVQGASPAQVGFKLLVRPDGSVVGNVGGGALEQRIRDETLAALLEGKPRLAHYTLREAGPDAVGMLCGGEVTAFIEVYQPMPILLIVGGGHIGRPLAEMARIVGFQVQVVDVHPERATAPQFDPAVISAHTYVVLITEDHVTDEQVLRQVLDTPAAYIGMIGSQRKVGIIFDHLRADGIGEEQFARVRAPIGLNLGGRSPAEIALSILAQIVQVQHGGTGQPLTVDSPTKADADET
jgi:xanthine dehydrogenase accessory factor